MNKGDPVEVNLIWASGGPLKPPLRTWARGYTFERDDKDTVLVRNKDGDLVRYPVTDVRPVTL